MLEAQPPGELVLVPLVSGKPEPARIVAASGQDLGFGNEIVSPKRVATSRYRCHRRLADSHDAASRVVSSA